MKQPDLILNRFPRRASEIRRRLVSDPRFREVCEDLETAEQALRHWQAQAQPDATRIREYGALCEELAEELRALLGPDDAARRAPTDD